MDTHALLWWCHEPEKLSERVLTAIAGGSNDVMVDAVSAMEIATKARRGRLEYDTPLSDRFIPSLAELGFVQLAINCAHAERAGNLAGRHKDPWDRLLAAQSQIEELALVSSDEKMATFSIKPYW